MRDMNKEQPAQDAGAFRSGMEGLRGGRAMRLKRLEPGRTKAEMSYVSRLGYDARDFLAEAIEWLLSHGLPAVSYRGLLHVAIGQHTSIRRGCHSYCPSRMQIDDNSLINYDAVLDGRMGLVIGDNVSISEGVAVLTLGHGTDGTGFGNRGRPVCIADRVFVGTRAVVTKDVASLTIVAGVPARPIGLRRQDLDCVLACRKFLG